MRVDRLFICLFLLLALALAAACGPAAPEPAESAVSAPSEAGSVEPSDVSEPETSETESADPSSADEPGPASKAMTDAEILDRIEGSWAAQMAGVVWGASTEFQYLGKIIPENGVPAWKPEMINNAFGQDDLYVEIPFLNALAENGVSCPLETLANAFRDTTFPLDHANKQGRLNLQAGIPAPQSGNYAFNYHCDDIDWQIEADFLGNLFPGMPDKAAERAFEIGHIMNYGDGVYGGVYIAVMHAAAYTADSVYDIAEAGRKAIPEGTKFRSVLDEVNDCYKAGMTWEECWQKIQDDWASGARCVAWKGRDANIDAKINAAYVHMGLLWGNGDFAETIRISMRCGQDSDCNPSSSAGVLGTYYGLKKLPAEYVSALNRKTLFSCTEDSFDTCVRKSADLLSAVLAESGIGKEDGAWQIPVNPADGFPEEGLVPFEQWPSDALNAYLNVVTGKSGEVRITGSVSLPEGFEGEPVHSLDMGDGTVFPFLVNSYRYLKDGTFDVTYTVKAGDQEASTTVTVTVAGAESGERGFEMTPASSVPYPLGGGSKDISVLTDGFGPGSMPGNTEQYDTFTGAYAETGWYELRFDRSVHVTGVSFTEGLHFDNGGWFDAPPSVQLLKDGKWTDAKSECSPPYGGHAPATTFLFTLAKADWCDGIRVIGKPGGSATFISCCELDVLFDKVRKPSASQDQDPVKEAVIIATVTDPLGTGCKDINIIRDGYLPSASDSYVNVSYDTFAYNAEDHEEFIGYMFRSAQTVKSVTFTEGAHFNDGGYFKDGKIRVEALVGDDWKAVDATPDKAYPVGNAQGLFGQPYESYCFTFASPLSCTGVRVIGSAGGSMHFISVSELSVAFAK